MITRIYHPADLVSNTRLQLDKQASHHLVRVLRLKAGAGLVLFNGNGKQYDATIVEADQKHCVVDLGQSEECNNESPLDITLLQGVSRSDRMDASIQKSTELGVNRIIPFISQRTSVTARGKQADKKHTHWKKVVISACEQSGRCTLPAVNTISTFDEALEIEADVKLLLQPQAAIGLGQIERSGRKICVLIGPESGFSDEETVMAQQQGYIAVRFGPRVLRTETAGPAIISAVQTLWGDTG